MRATLGRCFEKPIELEEGALNYEKLLVRPGDAHWYAFTAGAGGPATIHAEPTGDQAQDLALSGLLMDAAGHVLHEAGGGAGGFVIDCELDGRGALLRARIGAQRFHRALPPRRGAGHRARRTAGGGIALGRRTLA